MNKYKVDNFLNIIKKLEKGRKMFIKILSKELSTFIYKYKQLPTDLYTLSTENHIIYPQILNKALLIIS